MKQQSQKSFSTATDRGHSISASGSRTTAFDDSAIPSSISSNPIGSRKRTHRRNKSNVAVVSGGVSTEDVRSPPSIRRIISASKSLDDIMNMTENDSTSLFDHYKAEFVHVKHNAEQFVKNMVWKVQHFMHLPEWMQDNDFIHHYHRPPMPSFVECFKSVFRIHSETGNIWTHGLGCFAFILLAIWFVTRPPGEIGMQEKVVFTIFFVAAILCLGFSSAFHTVSCHSPRVGKIFSKLDYCGISIMIVGSFIPWLFYCFYCEVISKWTYMVAVGILGCVGVLVSLSDKFSTPQYRTIRAVVFVSLGLSGVVPTVHYTILNGIHSAIYEAALGWLILMAILYIAGALLYACRIPERYFPGKCDLWFQSHQIFHLCVIAAAFVHYHGIMKLANFRMQNYDCSSSAESASIMDLPPLAPTPPLSVASTEL